MAAVSIVLTVYCFGCAAIATLLLVFVVRYFRENVIQETEKSWLEFVDKFVYAAIVVIWLMMGHTVLMLL